MMNKVLIGLLGAGVIATGGYAAASGIDNAAPARTVSLPGATTTSGTTTSTATTDDIVVGTAPATGVTGTTGEDVSGPCDEAEHRNDPRCAGAATPAPSQTTTTGDDDGPGDISGPCDEAEHANDSRCTGGATTDDDGGDDDRSGSNRGSDDDAAGDDHGDDDRSGSNSGKG